MTRMFGGLIAMTCAVAVLPSIAGASTPSTPGTTTTTSTGTTPVPPPPKPVPPAKGQLNLGLTGMFHVNGRPVTVTNRALRVNGVVRPFVAGQTVNLRAFIGGRLIHSQRLRVLRSRSGRYGYFSARFSSSRAGSVSVSAVHAASTKLVRLQSNTSFATLTPSAGMGSRGRFVELLQLRLALLHFYIPQTGVYDGGTGWAIDAYRRLLRHGVGPNLDPAIVNGLLNKTGSFHIRFAREGKHVEGNLSLQLLALAYGGRVFRIFPISSGKPSTPTVLGHFNVYLKDPGYLSDGMYFSSFFFGGYAIHGFNPAPDYPASHGCMRVPISDAVPIYNWLSYGNGVDVYY